MTTLPLREKDIQETLRQAFNLHRWLYYHVFDSRRTNYGFPDICAVGPMSSPEPRLLFWELKSAPGQMTPAQEEWITLLRRVQAPPLVQVVYPRDLDTCLEQIAALSRRQ